jgi:hypothetical protein
MTKPNYQKQPNRQIAATNAGIILAEIQGYYPIESVKDMAAKINRSESALLRWKRTGKARYKDMEALIAAYPIPLKDKNSQKTEGTVQNVPPSVFMDLFVLIDLMKAISDNLRIQLNIQEYRRKK